MMKNSNLVFVPILLISIVLIALLVILYFEKKKYDNILNSIAQDIFYLKKGNSELSGAGPGIVDQDKIVPLSLPISNEKKDELKENVNSDESKEEVDKDLIKKEIEEYELELQQIDNHIHSIELQNEVEQNEDSTVVSHEHDIDEESYTLDKQTDEESDTLDKQTDDEEANAIQTDEEADVIQTDEEVNAIQTDEENEDKIEEVASNKSIEELMNFKSKENIPEENLTKEKIISNITGKYTISQLKQICKDNKLTVKGNKPDLLERIYNFNLNLL